MHLLFYLYTFCIVYLFSIVCYYIQNELQKNLTIVKNVSEIVVFSTYFNHFFSCIIKLSVKYSMLKNNAFSKNDTLKYYNS